MTSITDTAQSQAAPTIEWAPFTLAEGVGAAALLAASEALQRDFLSKQRGFLHRELLKGSDGQWVDLIYWESRDAVRQAMDNVQTSAVCQSYFTLMVPPSGDDPSGAISLFDRIQRYAGHSH
jgi:hypothetical protein